VGWVPPFIEAFHNYFWVSSFGKRPSWEGGWGNWTLLIPHSIGPFFFGPRIRGLNFHSNHPFYHSYQATTFPTKEGQIRVKGLLVGGLTTIGLGDYYYTHSLLWLISLIMGSGPNFYPFTLLFPSYG